MKAFVAIALLVVQTTTAQQVPYGLVPPAPLGSQYPYQGPFAPEFYGPQQLRFRRGPAAMPEPPMTPPMAPPTTTPMMNPLLTNDYYPTQQQQPPTIYPNSLLTLDEMSRIPLFNEYLSLPLFRQWLPSYSFQQFLASPLFQRYWTSPVFLQFFREPELFYKYVYPEFQRYQYQQPAAEQLYYPSRQSQMPSQEQLYYPSRQQQPPQEQFYYPLRQTQQAPQEQFYYPSRQQLPPQEPFYYPSRRFESMSEDFGDDYYGNSYGQDYFPRTPMNMYSNDVDSYGPTYMNKPATPVVYLLRPEPKPATNNWYNPVQNAVVTRRVEVPFRVLKVPAPKPQLDEQLVEKIIRALFLPALEAEMEEEEEAMSKAHESKVDLSPPEEEEEKKMKFDDSAIKFVPLEENPEAMEKMVPPKTMEPETVSPVSVEQPQEPEVKDEVAMEATTESAEPEKIDLVKMLTQNKRFARFDKKPTKLEKKEKLIGAEERAINSGYYSYDTLPPQVTVDVQKRSEDAAEPSNYKTTDTDGLHSVPLSEDQSSWSKFNGAEAAKPENFKGNDDDDTYSRA